MNIKNIAFVSFLSLGIVAIGLFSKKEEPSYIPRLNSSVSQTDALGAAEYNHMLRANPTTGKLDIKDYYMVRNQVADLAKRNHKSGLGMKWDEKGPDNVGGRSRAVLVDRDDDNLMYAGGVSGGLFISTNKGANWEAVADHNLSDNLAVSCITQTENGRIFFGTGSDFESINGSNSSGFLGNGLYEYDVATKKIKPVITNTSSTGQPNIFSGTWAEVNALAHSGNRLYAATSDGLLMADLDGDSYPSATSGWTNPLFIATGVNEKTTCKDVVVGSNGSVLATFSGKIYRSTPATASSTGFSMGEEGSFESTFLNGSRIGVAIAPSDPNYMYAVATSSCLNNIYISKNAGESWEVIIPGGSEDVDPFSSGDRCQGGYDLAVAVDPTDRNQVLVGGITLWRLIINSNGSGTFSWDQAAGQVEQLFPFYVHSDIHTIFWEKHDEPFIGCDGGVFRSLDGGITWSENNLGFNVTQFYGLAVNNKGWMIGGTQDNGTPMFSFGSKGSITPLGTINMHPGFDGFDAEFSNFGGGIIFTTHQNGGLRRGLAEAAAEAQSEFYADALNICNTEECGPFFTKIKYWESFNDPLCRDSVIFTVADTTSWAVGEYIEYESLTNVMKLYYPVTESMTMVPGDTMLLPDPVASKLVIADALGEGLHITRDASSLNRPDPDWDLIASSSSIPSPYDSDGRTLSLEFSEDGDMLFAGTASGRVYRIDSLGRGIGRHTENLTAFGLDALDIDKKGDFIRCTQIGRFSGPVTDIAVDPNDADNIVITLGGYFNGTHVYKCTNATQITTPASGTSNFSGIQGPSSSSIAGFLPKMPIYSVEIDMNDKDVVLLGTEWGVWATSNAFSSSGALVKWYDENENGMARVPVFSILQQQMPLGTANGTAINSMEYYIGTHGRGFYSSNTLVDSTVVGIDEEIIENVASFKTKVQIYPNPVLDRTKLSFYQKERSSVSAKIYNLRGALVMDLKLGMLTGGKQELELNLDALEVGSYIVSLESASSRSTAKFVKIK